MADERNVAHDKKVAADKAKADGGGVGEDSAANVDGDRPVHHRAAREAHAAAGQEAPSERRRRGRGDVNEFWAAL